MAHANISPHEQILSPPPLHEARFRESLVRAGLLTQEVSSDGKKSVKAEYPLPHSHRVQKILGYLGECSKQAMVETLCMHLMVDSGLLFKDVFGDEPGGRTRLADAIERYALQQGIQYLSAIREIIAPEDWFTPEGNFDTNCTRVVLAEFNLTLQQVSREFARIWNSKLKDIVFRDQSRWHPTSLLALMYPEYIRLCSSKESRAHCPFGQGDIVPPQSQAANVDPEQAWLCLSIRECQDDWGAYFQCSDAFEINPQELPRVMEDLLRFKLDMTYFSWPAEDWNDFVHSEGTKTASIHVLNPSKALMPIRPI